VFELNLDYLTFIRTGTVPPGPACQPAQPPGTVAVAHRSAPQSPCSRVMAPPAPDGRGAVTGRPELHAVAPGPPLPPPRGVPTPTPTPLLLLSPRRHTLSLSLLRFKRCHPPPHSPLVRARAPPPFLRCKLA
jgi:hypothetical protein